jgi:hypothetical protein
MYILVITNSPAEGKLLTMAILSRGHTATWRIDTNSSKKEIENKLWDIDAIVCSSDNCNLSGLVAWAEQLDYLKDQRGYHQRPYIVVLAKTISIDIAARIRAVGGFPISGTTDIGTLLAFLEIFDSQVTQEFYRPYLLLEHGYWGSQNLFCDESEGLLGVSVGFLGPPIGTDQTNRTAVLTDYLCRQKYAKTEEEICAGIAASRFYRAQLGDKLLRETAIKMLVCHARKRLAPALFASRSGLRPHQVIANVSGHTRKYKIDVVVKVVHRRLGDTRLFQS